MNTYASLQAEAHEVRRLLRDAGYTQQKLASELGVSQSQVSRLLSGQMQRRTKLFDRMCSIAYRALTPRRGLKRGTSAQQADLIAALDAVWDGSPAHAKALATVIRSLNLLKPSLRQSRSSQKKGIG